MNANAIQTINHWNDVQSNPIKTIFVCEFITGGGLHHSDLPEVLAFEGALMRDALLNDLLPLGYQVSTTVDKRLMTPIHCNSCWQVNKQDDVWQLWDKEIQQSDAVWIIAPETGGFLEKMTAIALKHHKKIIGSGLTAIKVFSSKLSTYQLLKDAGITTPPTFTFDQWLKGQTTQWLAKPVDGAGCEETVHFELAEALERWLIENNKQKTHIIQPFLEGIAASFSCVVQHGQANLLSCNEQLVTLKGNTLNYEGCIVNGMRQYWELFNDLANKVASLLPDTSGYVGIDVIVSHDGKRLTVIEVNPRLTTSYVGLKQATGFNPAELILQTCLDGVSDWPKLEQNLVEIKVGQHHA